MDAIGWLMWLFGPVLAGALILTILWASWKKFNE